MSKRRFKNPWFWIGIVGILLTATGATPESFTSWGAVRDCITATVSNPYILFSALLAVLGVFVDPTTNGLTDRRN